MEKENVNMDGVNHMDLALQIDNDWKRDTILAYRNQQKGHSYTIRLKNKDKGYLKKKYLDYSSPENRRNNKRIINLIFGYMIVKIIMNMKVPISKVLICPDHRPTKEVHHFIQAIAHHLGKSNLTSEVDIAFINRRKYGVTKKTPAHILAGKVVKGKQKSSAFVDIKELEEIITKIKKNRGLTVKL
jgi:hypothetical protein